MLEQEIKEAAQGGQLNKLSIWECKTLILENLNDKEFIDKLLAQRPKLKIWFDMTIPRQYKKKVLKERPIVCPNCAFPFSVAR